MIKNLHTDLKIFKFDAGETDWIVANNYAEAEEYYLHEINPDVENIIDEVDLKVIDKNDKTSIDIGEEEELRLLVNRYTYNKDKIDRVNIWDLLVYDLLSYKLIHNEDHPIPFLIATTNL